MIQTTSDGTKIYKLPDGKIFAVSKEIEPYTRSKWQSQREYQQTIFLNDKNQRDPWSALALSEWLIETAFAHQVKIHYLDKI